MQTRKASIKETGEELPAAEWERFDEAVAKIKVERKGEEPSKAPEKRPKDSDTSDQAVA